MAPYQLPDVPYDTLVMIVSGFYLGLCALLFLLCGSVWNKIRSYQMFGCSVSYILQYLYTLVVTDTEKADKLAQSLPPGLQRKDI